MKYHPRAGYANKGFKSVINEIATDTFNMGQNKFAAQVTQSRQTVANYLQHISAYKRYLVAETVRVGREQVIKLPLPVKKNAAKAEDQKMILAKQVKTIAKRRLNWQSP